MLFCRKPSCFFRLLLFTFFGNSFLKLCKNSQHFGRRFSTHLLVFPLSPRLDITIFWENIVHFLNITLYDLNIYNIRFCWNMITYYSLLHISFIRLTPTYMFCILLVAKLRPFFGAGPVWFTQAGTSACSKNWWKKLLYLDNFLLERVSNRNHILTNGVFFPQFNKQFHLVFSEKKFFKIKREVVLNEVCIALILGWNMKIWRQFFFPVFHQKIVFTKMVCCDRCFARKI